MILKKKIYFIVDETNKKPVYTACKKIYLSDKESKILDNKTSELLHNFNFDKGTNEIEIFLQSIGEENTKDNTIFGKLKKDMQTHVNKTFNILKAYLDQQNT